MKSTTSNKGQASLELILLTSVFFSVLLLFMPLISKAFFLGLYSLDVLRAKTFSESFTASVLELNSMSQESVIEVAAEPLLEWNVKLKGKKLQVNVILKNYGKQKTFTESQFNVVPFNEITVKNRTVFILTKTEKGILVETKKA
jgi:hypothetical protein